MDSRSCCTLSFACRPKQVRLQLELRMSTNSEFWRDMESRFRSLQAEYGDSLHANWSPTSWDGDRKQWYLSSAQTASEEQRFRVLADRGAVALGCATAAGGLFFWLDLLRTESPHTVDGCCCTYYNADGEKMIDQSRIVSALHKASAEFCLQLE